MKTYRTATGSGSNVSGGVCLPKGTTLKGIMLICSSVVNKKYYSTSLIILDTPRIRLFSTNDVHLFRYKKSTV